MSLFGAAAPVRLSEGAHLLPGVAAAEEMDLIGAVEAVASAAPFRHMVVPSGHAMSVAMTNCGALGWVTDRAGYRYCADDPLTGQPWPSLPPIFLDLAQRAAAAGGFPGFMPDACLINRYDTDARMGLHQDRNERDLAAPIVSVSLGRACVFAWGGLTRRDKVRRIRLESGDIVVWGGPSRLVFHGVERLADDGRQVRFNLTFRKAC